MLFPFVINNFIVKLILLMYMYQYSLESRQRKLLIRFKKQKAQEGQYCSTAIRQKLNLQTAPPPDGHPRNISTKLFENQPDTFGGEDSLSFHYSHIRQNSPTLWRPCFSTNQHGLKESDRGSLKEHFYKIIWKFAKHLLR